jgi:hypothetical protein
MSGFNVGLRTISPEIATRVPYSAIRNNKMYLVRVRFIEILDYVAIPYSVPTFLTMYQRSVRHGDDMPYNPWTPVWPRPHSLYGMRTFTDHPNIEFYEINDEIADLMRRTPRVLGGPAPGLTPDAAFDAYTQPRLQTASLSLLRQSQENGQPLPYDVRNTIMSYLRPAGKKSKRRRQKRHRKTKTTGKKK